MATQTDTSLETMRQQVEILLKSGDQASLRKLLETIHPADIADLLEQLDDEQRVPIFNLLHEDSAADVLDETSDEVARDIIDGVPDERIADLLEAMPMDDAAEILSVLEEERAEDLLELMEPEEAAEVEVLLSYPEDTAGRLMTTEVVHLNENWTVESTLDYLRTVDPEVETLTYLYVINGGRQLVGVVPLRKLVTSPTSLRISEIMEPDIISVAVDTDQEEVARMVAQYDFTAIPVVDGLNRFIGVITHDDVVDILQDEFTEDAQRFGGSLPLEESYLSSSVFTVFRKRVGWLMVLFITQTLTGSVMRFFESELEALVALTFFIPLMIGTGGNAGSQTTSTITRALGVGDVRFSDLGRLLWHELGTGLLLGLVMGVLGYIRAITWGHPVPLALTVGFSLFVLVIWANGIGALLPTLAAKVGIDPAVISGPVMSTLVDATGLLIYFSLAALIIGL